jgi:DNA polymerase-3 subunit beta
MEDITNDEKRLAEIAAAAPPKRKRAKKEEAAEAAPAGPMTLPSPTAVVLDAGKLADALALVRRATGKTLPILSCVLMRIPEGSGAMQLACTNCDQWASIWVPIVSGAKGHAAAVAVSAAALAKLLGEVEATEVIIDMGDKLLVRAGAWKAELCVLAADDFPPNPLGDGRVKGEHPVELADGMLKKALGAVSCAVSKDETRYVLNGVLLRFRGDELLLAVATDGRRLAMVERMEGVALMDREWQVILPTAAVKLLMGALSDGKEVGLMRTYQKDAATPGEEAKVFAISLLTGGCGLEMWTKVIEGEYPNFYQVIPGGPVEEVKLDGGVLVEMCDRGGMLEPKGVDIIAVGRAVTVRASAPDVGMWEETAELISADDMMQARFEVRVNPQYAEVLGVGELGELDVGPARSKGPLVWRSELTAADHELHYTGVLMPLRSEGGDQ